ncbi:MAG TPA: hypothetical protein VGH28_25685 [Polyangiaceae bacterium]|jgi:hypothetical protein
MPIEHVIFIPGVLLIGTVLGYILGVRTERQRLGTRRRRMKE